jgi:alkylation response protein AidB-like acyl-CoA dehydrogenase
VKLDLSPDQELVRDTTRRFLAEHTPLTEVRRLADDALGYDRAWWRQGAELGWTSMLVPAEHGGASLTGEGLRELVLVAEEMGRLVSPGPLVPVNVVAAALGASGTDAQRGGVLASIIAGDAVAAWCVAEPGGAWGPAADVALVAEPTATGWSLTGTKSPVEAAAGADHLLVVARGPDGPIQLLVDADAPGVTVVPLRSLDLVRRFAEVRFDRAEVPGEAVVGTPGAATAADVERQLQLALALQCAETVGAVDRVFTFTLEYAFDRYSFGRPLASYQALKHRFADMKTWLEACHATAGAAADGVQTGGPDAARLASIAAAYIGERSTPMVQDCVQLHGGIGITWEHDIHLYLRRVTVNRALYGTPSQHRERVVARLAA